MDSAVPSSVAEGKKRDRSPGERRTLAAMACETCRMRKSRCDEQRPRCGLCQKLNKSCVYQEPKPTKKDNTLGLILDTLHALTIKLDRVLVAENAPPSGHPVSCSITDSPANSLLNIDEGALSLQNPVDNIPLPNEALSAPSSSTKLRQDPFQVPPRQITEVHKLLTWPALQALLRSEGIEVAQWHGDNRGTENWLTEVTENFGIPLPLDRPMDIDYIERGTLNLEQGRSITLNRVYIEDLCATYFCSFHCTYPILDRRVFYSETLPHVVEHGFSEAQEGSCLVLLVLALGALAKEGATGVVIRDSERDTGLRGGSVERPPGLLFLNEAKRRWGLMMTHWSIINVQTSILFSIYYAQISRNLEFWRMAIFSCTICQSLVKSVTQWGGVRTDQIARCFWMCCILEGGFSGEFGLDLPGITALQDSVPLPAFLTEDASQSEKSDDDIFIEYHFLAQITLRTLINRARQSTQESRALVQLVDTGEMPQKLIMQELAAQLENWRTQLPQAISFPREPISPEQNVAEALTPIDPSLAGMLDFKVVLNASLRTRYKYAEYVIWRPYIYQILHLPMESPIFDYENALRALKACSMWPLSFATYQAQRRLIPHLYEYTHAFFGILMLLHVCSFTPTLRPLLLNSPASYEIELSIDLFIAWIRDMKIVHPVAKWCWNLLKVIYKGHPLVESGH